MAYIKQLQDGDKVDIYPVTKAKATYMGNGLYSVEDAINELQEADALIKFTENSIIKKASNGNITTTTIGEGRIIEDVVTRTGLKVRTKTTTFNSDGSIDIKVVEGE